MFEPILAAVRRIACRTARSLRRKRSVALELLSLEERAVPAADVLFSFDPPEVVVVAELTPFVVNHQDATQPIVRIDLMPAGAPGRAVDVFDLEEWLASTDDSHNEIAGTDDSHETHGDSIGETTTDTLVVTEDELLHAKMNEELRKLEA
jgi:hypothetical protein